MTYWQERVLREEARANRLANATVKANRSYLQQAHRNLEREIAELQGRILSDGVEITRTELWRYGKYTELQNAIEREIGAAGAKQIRLLDDAAKEVFETTLETLMGELGGRTINYQMIAEGTVEQAVRQVWRGTDYSARVWNNTNKLASRVKQLVDDALVLGKGSTELTQSLMREFGTSYNVANRLIRTELSHTFNTASLRAYEEAGIEEVEVLVAYDERLCEECSS